MGAAGPRALQRPAAVPVPSHLSCNQNSDIHTSQSLLCALRLAVPGLDGRSWAVGAAAGGSGGQRSDGQRGYASLLASALGGAHNAGPHLAPAVYKQTLQFVNAALQLIGPHMQLPAAAPARGRLPADASGAAGALPADATEAAAAEPGVRRLAAH